MYYVYQPLGGDGSIVARVTGVQNANVWSRAGVMIRETLATDSTNAFMYLSAGKTLAFQRRHTRGASTFGAAGATSVVAPYWVRLDRSGDTFTAYRSTDGITWTLVGIDTVTMSPDVYLGLAVTSATLTATSLGTFDNVTVTPGTPTPPVTPPSPAPLPDRWLHHEIGPVGFTGDTTFDAVTNAFTVKGAGSDVGGTADSFHFAHRVLTGDGWILARVKSLQNTSPSAKAGVMMRAALDPGGAHAFMRVTPGNGTAFDRRQTAGGNTLSTPGTTDKAPYWVKVERVGDTFTASQSADGVNWTLVAATQSRWGRRSSSASA